MQAMNEFDFITKYLAGLAGPEGLDLLDDAALWTPPAGLSAVISTDTLVEGVHFPDGKFDSELAQKLIRVNISDIVAKGADPIGYSLSLTINENVSEMALESFCAGLASDQDEYGLKLWGGDTTQTSGPNVLTITIFGTVPSGAMVKRSGAQVGDVLCVTGCIGDSYLGLKTLLKQIEIGVIETDIAHWLQAYHVPRPAFKLRRGIRTLATAALDVSDGLIADAQHLSKASNVAVIINLNEIPVSPSTQTWLDGQPNRITALKSLATGGDDYQVLAAMNPSKFDELRHISVTCGVRLTKVGRIEQGNGIRIKDKNGEQIAVERHGYTHF